MNLIDFYYLKGDGFMSIQNATDRIIKNILFEASENEEIDINKNLLVDRIETSIHLGKTNSHSSPRQLLSAVIFTSNSDSKALITFTTYN